MTTTVTSYTAEKIDELTNALVASASYNAQGHLVLVMGDGSTLDIGTDLSVLGIIYPSGDTDGSTDPGVVENALSTYGNALLMPGDWYGDTSISPTPGQDVKGCGIGRTIWHTVGSASSFKWYNASTLTETISEFSGITIDGSAATGEASGYELGDIFGCRVDVKLQNFTADGPGTYYGNPNWWTECGDHKISISNCNTGIYLDQSGAGTGSYDRARFDLTIEQFASQDTIIFGGETDGVQLLEGSLKMRGNYRKDATGGGHVIKFVTANASIQTSNIQIGIEVSDGANPETDTFAPQTINFLDDTTRIENCGGIIEFYVDDNSFLPSNNDHNFWFDGPVIGDTSLVTNVYSPYYNHFTDSGFPTGWSGNVIIEMPRADGLVYIQMELEVVTGTVITNGEAIVTGLPDWASPNSDTIIVVDNSGAYCPMKITGTSLEFNGAGVTLSGNKFIYGQGVYSNSR